MDQERDLGVTVESSMKLSAQDVTAVKADSILRVIRAGNKNKSSDR